jgi:predicted outer membrane repeat protein
MEFSGNTVKRSDYGIYIAGSDAEVDMKETVIDSCGIGVHIEKGADFWAGDTISVDSLAGNTITNCTSYLVRTTNMEGEPNTYCQHVWWGSNLGPDVQKIAGTKYATVYYNPWTEIPYDCSSSNVHCVPSEYPTIDSAITIADTTSGTYDTLYIGVGTFEESGLEVNKPILIVGSGIDSTIIDGENLPPRVFTTDNLASGDTIWAEHFTIKNGLDTTSTDSRSAAGWQIYTIDGIVMLDSVKFESCSSMVMAGAIGSWHGDLSIDHCYFIDNYGGLTVVESRDNDNAFWVKNSRFTNNTGQYGGGIKLYSQAGAYIEDCIFEQNTATKWGGAINARSSGSNKYYNNTFFGNYADIQGGATDHTRSSSTTWLNCIFRNDSTDGNGDEIYIDNSTYHLLYCDIDTMDIYGKSYLNSKIGLIDSDPYFWDEEALDLHLTDSSDCIEAGKDTLDADSLDFDGVARSDTFDIGAYEYYGDYSPKELANSDVKLPEVNQLGDIYPNPFNMSVTIEFSLIDNVDVQVDIYSMDGRMARRLLRQPISHGQWKTVWDGRDNSGREVSSGVYLVKMKVDGADLETKTVTLIK